MSQRPLSVTLIAWVYIGAGAIGFTYHFKELSAGGVFHYGVWIELIRLLAVVCGAFMLRGRDWTRWLGLAWIGFHVVVSAFHNLGQLAIHCLIFAAIAWFLLRPDASRYFRPRKPRPSGVPSGD